MVPFPWIDSVRWCFVQVSRKWGWVWYDCGVRIRNYIGWGWRGSLIDPFPRLGGDFVKPVLRVDWKLPFVAIGSSALRLPAAQLPSPESFGVVLEQKTSLLRYTIRASPWGYSLANRTIMVPHQMAQPHPTTQKMMVKHCDTPTIQLMMNDPMRPLIESCCEKRGFPMQRHSAPDRMVPEPGITTLRIWEIRIQNVEVQADS